MRSLQSIRSLFLAPVRSGSLLEVVTYTVMGSSAKREYSQEFLQKCYDDHRALWESKKQPENVNPRAVFASNELDLRDIKVYGFDYDYTLAHYEEAVEHLIYDLGKNVLISKYRQNKMAHLADLFSLPEMCLLSQVAQYFLDNNIPYHSVPLFNDVKAAIASIHPEMHRVVGRNISEYLIKDPSLVDFFDRLKKHNKEIFIITNSPFYFVNAGMSYILGENWRDYFDVVVANAKKPAFFTDSMRPFRELNEEIHVQTWGPVTSLDKGKIYLEGNLQQLQQVKGWQGQEVLYFGDHPYTDLADVSLNHSWRTGAIIWELDYEIQCLNSEEYKKTSGWLMILQSLIESCQDFEDEESRKMIKKWEMERDQLRKKTKAIFNPHFGSVFRTHDNPTYFSRRLFRYADVYTSRLSNLNNYSINHTFYPRRGVLPHEYKALFV
nr:5'-nucleotidase domain-containing protein 3-like isoform X2 [Cherax quadricarinatus]